MARYSKTKKHQIGELSLLVNGLNFSSLDVGSIKDAIQKLDARLEENTGRYEMFFRDPQEITLIQTVSLSFALNDHQQIAMYFICMWKANLAPVKSPACTTMSLQRIKFLLDFEFFFVSPEFLLASLIFVEILLLISDRCRCIRFKIIRFQVISAYRLLGLHVWINLPWQPRLNTVYDLQ